MKIETVEIDKLKPFERNPKKHPESQLKKLEKSISEFGWTNPILATTDNMVVAGHARLEAAKRLNIGQVPVIYLDLPYEKAIAYVIADNRLAELAETDTAQLSELLGELSALPDFDIELTGFDVDEVAALNPAEVVEDNFDAGAALDGIDEPVTQRGDLILLGRHRLYCGDSTVVEDVKKLMDGEKATLLHADPPYGMGKENEGVLNDNLYNDKLDKFQMMWLAAYRTHIEDNASVYIWGTALDLWRLWYSGGLNDSEQLTFRNEIVWNKGSGQGMNSEEFRSYPLATERCIFYMIGVQGFNTNADNYFEGWEPVRDYLLKSRLAMGWDIPTMKKIVGHSDLSRDHWTSKSQFSFPTRKVYEAMKADADKKRKETNNDAFKKEYDELKKEYDELKKEYDELKKEYYSTRAHFDNTHDTMIDVWDYKRVNGDDRCGHATPKPVEMVARIIKSSSPVGGRCVEPFLGSGSTLIAAEQTNRICYGMELSEQYCDVIVKRWEEFTDQKAIRPEHQPLEKH
jgi:DNA modification methylase